MKVTSILKTKGSQVATVRPEATIATILRELTAKSIGTVVVSEDGVNLLGLVSERDIVQALGVYGARTLDLRASDIMMRRPVTCQPDDSVTRVMAEMTRHRVRHLPVVEGGRLHGIVSIGDVVKHRLDELETTRKGHASAKSARPRCSLFASSSTPRLDGHDRARLAHLATLLSNGASSAEALALFAHKSVSFQP